MSKKRAHRTNRTNHDSNIIQLHDALYANGRAALEGPKKRKWTKHDLKSIQAMTPTQADMIRSFIEGQHICAHGAAGTGKTYIGTYLALTELLNPAAGIDKIIFVRSAVQTRDQGFLPGTIEEKMAHYEAPYADIFTDLLGRKSSYQDMKDAGLVEFVTTSFIRGITWDNTIVIVDEGQNLNFHEINSVMTRLGDNSRVLYLGDLPQTDLRRNRNDTSGMERFLRVVSQMSAFACVKFTHMDIVRSEFVKSWIMASEVTD